jgi:predicted chitinase
MYDLATLFTYLRKAPFGGRISQRQVEGIKNIIQAWEDHAEKDNNKLAYVLATAFHETAATMQPVREGLAKSDSSAQKILAKYRYSQPDQVSKGKNTLPKTGKAYYGRGYVQITWADNYLRLGTRLGVPLHENPELALDPQISAKILVIGMLEGLFTTKKLSQYFSVKTENPEGARAIVNGKDKAALIASYYVQFKGALDAADTDTEMPEGIKPEAAKPDGASLPTDTTLIGGITGVIGSGAVGALGAISNPWALAAFVVVALGVFLLVTGRIEIKKKVGV